MSNVVQFKAQGKKYPLSIIDADGEKWITAQQLGEALGVKNMRRQIGRLEEAGEIVEGKHHRSLRLQCFSGGPERLVFSYRGVIRVALQSKGQRAREFRDWAEEVLFQVMVSGAYGLPDAVAGLQAAEASGLRKGLALAGVSAEQGVSVYTAAQVIKFRMLGLTQRQAGAAFGLTRWQVSRIEIGLRQAGIEVAPVYAQTQKKRVMGEIDHILTAPILMARGGGR